ncbi:response regulator transcription factor [Paenibacillus turpanensis]|uniref:response regulator transcription factor n=1 Tax=Paenibacillus turpanensis TaxID=2689078 RepID=UPI00140E9071|nr:response regulator transcription factor [Paenibacillus turpanensis]
MSTPNTILLVEDERLLAQTIKTYIKGEGYKVEIAYNGAEATAAFDRVQPILVLLDIRLPDACGIEICKDIRSRSNTPIIILSGRNQEEDILRGLGAGADDYITKPFRPRELVARIKAMLRRVWMPEPKLENIMVGDIRIEKKQKRVWVGGHEVEVTPIEFKLLRVFMEHAGQILSRQQLIERVHGHFYEGMDRTLDSHIKNLRSKIEEDPKNPQYIVTVFREGYQFQRLQCLNPSTK